MVITTVYLRVRCNVPYLKPMCDLDLKTVLFEIKNCYRSAKNPYRRAECL